MVENSTTPHHLFTLLEGTWTGESHRSYPSVIKKVISKEASERWFPGPLY